MVSDFCKKLECVLDIVISAIFIATTILSVLELRYHKTNTFTVPIRYEVKIVMQVFISKEDIVFAICALQNQIRKSLLILFILKKNIWTSGMHA